MSEWGDQTDAPQEDAPNPTQQEIDERGPSSQPADASWGEESWGETQGTPHEGEDGQAGDVA
jgi:hypothetical protein